MSFNEKLILMKTFVESQFEVIYISEFQTKANSYEDISWGSVWSYLSLRVSNKREFLWRHLLNLSLKLCKLMSLKPEGILMKRFVESKFRVMSVYEFQRKGNSSEHISSVHFWSYLSLQFPKKTNSYEDISWVAVWSYVTLRVSNKSEFLWRHFLNLSLELSKFMILKWKRVLINKFAECQFEVM